ncbi:MAG: carboxypeptidase regulatory-like domain-containing protein [Candidatus Riflebacteria bacterium]|nr:carboxypeptidase regulatory-like domain-containing protein [Candidatus Riflebacteria bacterium]
MTRGGAVRRTRLVALLVGVLGIVASCASVDPSIVRLPLSTPTGGVAGRVTAGGVPVPGAAVTTVPPTYSVATDALGRFTLGPVLPETLTVIAQASSHVSGSSRVTVLPGQTAQVQIEVVPDIGTGIIGQVTDGVYPVMGALVTTVPPTRAVTSGPAGIVEFQGLTTGTYRLDATKDGYYGATEYVTLEPGSIGRATLALTRRSDGVIGGIVTDGVRTLGSTTAVAQITLFDGIRKTMVTRPTLLRTPTVPGLEFEYFFDGLPTGSHVVQAEFPGYVPGVKDVRVVPPLMGNGEIVLSQDRTRGAIAGTVADPFWNNLPGAVVSVSPGPRTTSTDLDGRYRFWGLAPGTFLVSVSAGLYETGTLQLAVTGGNTADGSIRLVR